MASKWSRDPTDNGNSRVGSAMEEWLSRKVKENGDTGPSLHFNSKTSQSSKENQSPALRDASNPFIFSFATPAQDTTPTPKKPLHLKDLQNSKEDSMYDKFSNSEKSKYPLPNSILTSNEKSTKLAPAQQPSSILSSPLPAQSLPLPSQYLRLAPDSPPRSPLVDWSVSPIAAQEPLPSPQPPTPDILVRKSAAPPPPSSARGSRFNDNLISLVDDFDSSGLKVLGKMASRAKFNY